MSANFGNRLQEARMAKELSVEELALATGISAHILGRYERADMLPSIEKASKYATALHVNLDFLVGYSSLLVKNKKILQQLEDIDRLQANDKEHILYNRGNLLSTSKTLLAYK